MFFENFYSFFFKNDFNELVSDFALKLLETGLMVYCSFQWPFPVEEME